MTTATSGFFAHAFRGQARRIIEACVAGGAVGLSVTFASRKMSEIDLSLKLDPALGALEGLQEFDETAPRTCHELLKLVRRFLPSQVHGTLCLVRTLEDMTVCYNAVCADPIKYAEVPYMAYVLASRTRESINELALLFPYNSSSYRRVSELCQVLFDLQDMMYAEVCGVVRLAQAWR
jgi:hypothetical protein